MLNPSKKVLVIDDEPFNVIALTSMLKRFKPTLVSSFEFEYNGDKGWHLL